MNQTESKIEVADAIARATVEVTRERIPADLRYEASGYRYILRGLRDAVQCKIDSLMREFPSAGYGTRIDNSVMDGERCTTVIWRSAHCD